MGRSSFTCCVVVLHFICYLIMNAVHGFTIIEALLVVALMSVLAAAGIPFFGTVERHQNLDAAHMDFVQALRQAKTRAESVQYDLAWGVRVNPGAITLFAGSSYALRNQAHDELFAVSTRIAFSGPAEYVFARWSGDPSTTGTTTLTISGSSQSVAVNSVGLLSY